MEPDVFSCCCRISTSRFSSDLSNQPCISADMRLNGWFLLFELFCKYCVCVKILEDQPFLKYAKTLLGITNHATVKEH